MSKRTQDHLTRARDILDASAAKAAVGDFAFGLQAESIKAHLQDLETLQAMESVGRTYEIVDFRLIADSFKSGSVPLDVVAGAAREIRRMLGFAALRFTQGGVGRRRVPDDLYQELDLRLAGIAPGSTRLLIAAAAQRDLLDDGTAKHAIERVITVLESEGTGAAFLDSVSDLGPSGARSLREFLRILRARSSALEVTWTFAGEEIKNWLGDQETIAAITAALEATNLKEESNQVFRGVIELLSKRERIHLRSQTGELLRILFPKRLLAEVSQLHLDQEVALLCQVTETENPLTNESAHYYELLEISR
ncbi:hypothetical protein [Rhabdochromatium marinum]|uniref:hypothetical protein n=1 Tax=Rhabdochromatium marinum TaxID=48729 RepID=UPI0019053E17|nr:hypothetical protein [Rhabdochromatium marinum]MBK1650508.1 hypothetical protein [Rhabdochromatium marinum]